MKTVTNTDAESAKVIVTCTMRCPQCGDVTLIQTEGGCDDLPVTCLDCDGE